MRRFDKRSARGERERENGDDCVARASDVNRIVGTVDANFVRRFCALEKDHAIFATRDEQRVEIQRAQSALTKKFECAAIVADLRMIKSLELGFVRRGGSEFHAAILKQTITRIERCDRSAQTLHQTRGDGASAVIGNEYGIRFANASAALAKDLLRDVRR